MNYNIHKRLLKKALSVMIAAAVVWGAIPSMTSHTAAQETSAGLSAKMEELEQRQKEIQQRLNQTQNDMNRQEEYQKQLDAQIDVTQQQISLLNQKISDINEKISQENDRISAKQRQVDGTVEDFQRRMRAMYMASDPSMLSILLQSEGIGDFLSRLENVKRVSLHDQALINQLKKEKQELQAAKDLVEAEKESLQQTQESLNFKQKQLDDAYSKSQTAAQDLNKLYEQYKANKEEIDKALAQAEEEVQEAIRKAQEEQRRREEEERKRQEEEEKRRQEEEAKNSSAASGDSSGASSGGASSAGSSSGSSTGSGKFAWPVPGYNRYSNYGWRTWPDGSKEFHKGIDISGGGINGKNIVAADDGVVIVARNWDPGAGSYGKYVMISHNSSLVTLYGHASEVVVAVGQEVKKGQVIARVGSSGWSTGPHCHFEVRVNGSHTNPIPYLK